MLVTLMQQEAKESEEDAQSEDDHRTEVSHSIRDAKSCKSRHESLTFLKILTVLLAWNWINVCRGFSTIFRDPRERIFVSCMEIAISRLKCFPALLISLTGLKHEPCDHVIK